MKRQLWIDVWKGQLILLVVLGHAIGTAAHLTQGTCSAVLSDVFALIYMFHMPAFFFLSGYVGHYDIGFWTFAKRRFNRLIVPYLCFGFLSAFIFVAFNDVTHTQQALTLGDGYYAALRRTDWVTPFLSILHGGGWPNGEGFRCNSVLWFLPCMFMVQMTLYGVLRLAKRWNHLIWFLFVLVLLVAIWAQHLHIEPLPWGLSLLPLYLSSALIGRFAADLRLVDYISRLDKKVTWCVTLLLFGGLLSLVVAGLFYPLREYMLLRIAMSTIGIIASLALAILTSGPIGSILATLGLSSLGIMLMHKFVVIGLLVHVSIVRAMCSSDGVRSAAAVVLTTLVATSLSYVATIMVRHLIPWAIGEREKSPTIQVEEERA